MTLIDLSPTPGQCLKLWGLVRELSWMGHMVLEPAFLTANLPTPRLACEHKTGRSGDFLGT